MLSMRRPPAQRPVYVLSGAFSVGVIWLTFAHMMRSAYDVRYLAAALAAAAAGGLVMWAGGYRRRRWPALMALGVATAALGFGAAIVAARLLDVPPGAPRVLPTSFLLLVALGWAAAYVLDGAAWPGSPAALGMPSVDA